MPQFLISLNYQGEQRSEPRRQQTTDKPLTLIGVFSYRARAFKMVTKVNIIIWLQYQTEAHVTSSVTCYSSVRHIPASHYVIWDEAEKSRELVPNTTDVTIYWLKSNN